MNSPLRNYEYLQDDPSTNEIINTEENIHQLTNSLHQPQVQYFKFDDTIKFDR